MGKNERFFSYFIISLEDNSLIKAKKYILWYYNTHRSKMCYDDSKKAKRRRIGSKQL